MHAEQTDANSVVLIWFYVLVVPAVIVAIRHADETARRDARGGQMGTLYYDSGAQLTRMKLL